MEVILSSKRKAWLHALRLRTLPLALSSILMGSILAIHHDVFRIEIFILASLTTLFLQILSNLANDYGDSVHGADSSEREGPIRAVQSGLISLPEMKMAILLFSVLSLGSGVLLLYVAFEDIWLFLIFLFLGILAILAAVTYTSGSRPYGYAGLGDVSVFLFFGLLGVIGTYFLHTKSFDPIIILPAVSLGFFSTAVLNINNIRDIHSDTQAGKKSIPVRVGRSKAILYNWFLVLGGNFAFLVFIISQQGWGGLSAFIVFPLMIQVCIRISKTENPKLIDPYLKKMAITTLLWVIFLGIGLLLL